MAATTAITLETQVHSSLHELPPVLVNIIIEYAKSKNIFEKHLLLIQTLNNFEGARSLVSNDPIHPILVLFNDIIEEGVISQLIPRETLLSKRELIKILKPSPKLQPVRQFFADLGKKKSAPLTLDEYVEIIRRVRVIAIIHTAVHPVILESVSLGPDVQFFSSFDALSTHAYLLFSALSKKIHLCFKHQLEEVNLLEITELNLAWLEKRRGRFRESYQLKGCSIQSIIDVNTPIPVINSTHPTQLPYKNS